MVDPTLLELHDVRLFNDCCCSLFCKLIRAFKKESFFFFSDGLIDSLIGRYSLSFWGVGCSPFSPTQQFLDYKQKKRGWKEKPIGGIFNVDHCNFVY